MLKKGLLFLLATSILVLAPVLALAEAQEDIIAAAADTYLNAEETVINIKAAELLDLLVGENPPLVVDLRASEDFALGHIDGSVNMAFGTLFTAENLATLPDGKIVVSCYTGHTASQASSLLNMCGYDTSNHQWGIMGWTKDTDVATKQFENPTTDYPVETTVNEATETFDRPAVNNTDSTDPAEIIRAACDAYASSGTKNIKAADLLTLITDGDDSNDPIIVSIRAASIYEVGHIPGAINIPFKDIAKVENLVKLDPTRQIVVYCYTGRTASQATSILNVLGYDAHNLLWGMTGWTSDPDIAPYRFDYETSDDYPVVGE